MAVNSDCEKIACLVVKAISVRHQNEDQVNVNILLI